MFPQIIRSTQLDTPCLQQSRKTKMRCNCLFFEKNITRRVRRPFHKGQHCWGSMQTNNKNVGTCWSKSLTGFNCTQQLPSLLWFHANGRNKSQHCWVQQCWVLLANNVASVCMGLDYVGETSRKSVNTKTSPNSPNLPEISVQTRRVPCELIAVIGISEGARGL